jgi:hypothetical protein
MTIPVVQAAVDQRKEFFRHRLDRLFEIEIFYAIVIEGSRVLFFYMP